MRLLIISITVFLSACAQLQTGPYKLAQCDYAQIAGDELYIQSRSMKNQSTFFKSRPPNIAAIALTGGELTPAPYLKKPAVVGTKGKLQKRSEGTGYLFVKPDCTALYLESEPTNDSSGDVINVSTVDSLDSYVGKTFYWDRHSKVELKTYPLSQGPASPIHTQKYTVDTVDRSCLSPALEPQLRVCGLQISTKDGYKGIIDAFAVSEFGLVEKDPINPAWGAEVKESIREGAIMIGMTTEQVLLSWGAPDQVVKSDSLEGPKQGWSYRNGTERVYFLNNRMYLLSR